MKFLGNLLLLIAIVLMVAGIAIALFGPIVAWCLWGDHAAIGALCLSTAIAGVASAAGMMANRD